MMLFWKTLNNRFANMRQTKRNLSYSDTSNEQNKDERINSKDENFLLPGKQITSSRHYSHT